MEQALSHVICHFLCFQVTSSDLPFERGIPLTTHQQIREDLILVLTGPCPFCALFAKILIVIAIMTDDDNDNDDES